MSKNPKPRPHDLPQNVTDELQLQRSRVAPFTSADRLWQRVLNDEDRRQLGGDPEKAYRDNRGTVGMWIKLRGVTPQRAIVDVAHEIGFLDDSNYRWLLHEIGEAGGNEVGRDLPDWRPDLGELYWRKKKVRDVRVMRNPSNIHRLLDAFAAAGWPARIANPFTDSNAQSLHLALASLNSRLKGIRFHSQGGGAEVNWRARRRA
jgi:hypothetical protein